MSTVPAGLRRILVTGSRSWTDATTIHTPFAEHWDDRDAVLVSGACPTGAARITEMPIGDERIVPCPPELTELLHAHLDAFGTDGE